MKIRLLSITEFCPVRFRLVAASLLFIFGTGITVRAVVQVGAPQAGATFTVNSVADTNDGSCNSLGQGGGNQDCTLREAINAAINAGPANTVQFDPTLAGQTITLSQHAVYSNGFAAFLFSGSAANVIIQGLTGNGGVTISAGGTARIAFIENFATLILNDLTLTGGAATQGGAFDNFNGTLTMNRCTISGSTSNFGGAVYNAVGGANTTLNNCTVTSNHANQQGGAFYIPAGSLTLNNCTVAYNSALQAGAIYQTGNTLLVNTILSNNSGNLNIPEILGSVSASSHHNLIDDGNSSGGLTNGVNNNIVGLGAMLGSLASNGGPTQTFELLPGSPAINAGAVVSGLTTDQRGSVRDASPDIGAFEFNDFQPQSQVTTTADEDNGNADPRFGAGTSLREALAYAQSLGGAQTITFAPTLAGRTVSLSAAAGSGDGWASSSALSVTGNITINGLTISPGVTLGVGSGASLRHFVVRSGASLTLNNLTISGGKPQLANFDRGGAISALGDLVARNCTFTGNTSPGEGAAVRNEPGAANLVLDNCTFSGNMTGSYGSALSANGTQATLRYLTVTNNTAPSAFVLWGTQGTMVNCIVAGNSDDSFVIGNGGALTAQSTNNLLGAGSVTGLMSGINANQLGVPVSSLLLSALGNNGGPTPTIAIGAGSVAIDAGVAIAGLTTDQRGCARQIGAAPDIGAFEFIPAPVVITNPQDQTVQAGGTATFNARARYLYGGTAPSTLCCGAGLTPDQYLLSPNHGYQLLYQGDGNLVLYRATGPLWASGTAGQTPGQVIMQGDGNLVIYGPGGVQYATHTEGNPNAVLTLQDDGNLVIYAASVLIFATNTATPAAFDPIPTVQWQVSTDQGATFTNIAGATSLTLSFTVSQADNDKRYRAVFANVTGAVSTAPATLTVLQPLQSVSAVSQGTHGAAGSFDIPLTDVECRSGGATNDHTLAVTFAGNVSVTGATQAEVIGGSATIGTGGDGNGGAVTVAGNVVTIPLTNVANAQTVVIRLNSVTNDSEITDVTISARFLLGDTNGNGLVNSADISLVKLTSGQSVDATNFRNDVNVSGTLNSADVSFVKSKSGTGLP